jgi:hypothetical protein
VTLALKLLLAVTVKLLVAPAATVCETGVATMEKSVTFNVTVTLVVSVPKIPVIVRT